MKRWLFWTLIFVVISGFLVHFNVEIPYVSGWLGFLPGDIVLMKDGTLIPVPIVSALLIGAVFTVITRILRL